MAFCKNCGTEIREGASFCTTCGLKTDKNLTQQSAIDIKNKGAVNKVLTVISKITLPEKIKKCLNWKSAVALLIAIIITVSSATVIFRESDEEKIFNLVNNLGEAMTEGDFEKLLNCFEPKARNQIQAFMNIGSAIGGNYLGGVDLRDMWSLGSIGMAGESKDSKFVFTVHRLEFIDKSIAEIELSAGSDYPSASHEVIKAVKIDGEWYFEADKLF